MAQDANQQSRHYNGEPGEEPTYEMPDQGYPGAGQSFGRAMNDLGSSVANKVNDAVKEAIESPLLETTVAGAKAILLNITGGYDIGMQDVHEAADQIESVADKDAIIIFGTSIKEELSDELYVTVIATGFENTPGEYSRQYGLRSEDEESTGGSAGADHAGHTGKETLSDILKSMDGSSDNSESGDDSSSERFDIPSFLK